MRTTSRDGRGGASVRMKQTSNLLATNRAREDYDYTRGHADTRIHMDMRPAREWNEETPPNLWRKSKSRNCLKKLNLGQLHTDSCM